jgi:hypothetical protein
VKADAPATRERQALLRVYFDNAFDIAVPKQIAEIRDHRRVGLHPFATRMFDMEGVAAVAKEVEVTMTAIMNEAAE